MSSAAAQDAIRLGLAYIARSQRADGGFLVSSGSAEKTPASDTADLILHALTLDALRTLDGSEAETISEALSRYLLKRLPSDYSQMDTHALFCTLGVLYAYRPDTIGTRTIATVIRHLIDNEIEAGGPYRNALDARGDPPELATNSSISRFIHSIGGPFPQLVSFIEQNYATGADNRYYTASWPLQLLVERAHFSLTTADRHFWPSTSPTTTENLIAGQKADGSWATEYFCRDPLQGQDVVYGSRAVTTAVTLARIKQAIPVIQTSSRAAKQLNTENTSSIAAAAHHYTNTLSPLIAPTAHTMIDRIIRADKSHEIESLAARFADTLNMAHRLDPQTLQTLGIANLYNWTAYTIYDDFLDDEGNPQLLSTANVALRKSIELFNKAVPSSDFQQIVADTFDTIDAANAWEINHCRFPVHDKTIRIGTLPDYTGLHSLYERSLSHSLPVIGTLIAAGLPADGQTVAAVHTAFKQYLIIRQLSDDIHDWEEDLSAGHISYIVAQILGDADIPPGPQRLVTIVPDLQLVFWQQTLPAVITLINDHAATARQLLRTSGIVADSNVISQLIDGIERTVAHISTEQDQGELFVDAYSAGIQV